MKRTLLNVALLVATVAVFLIPVVFRRDPTKPNVSFPIREMVDSVAAESYSPNPVLPGGRTLQTPVPGTIAHGEIPLHYQNTPEDAVRAGEELTNPFAGPAAAQPVNDMLPSPMDQGAALYQIYCQHCHGPSGAGDGMVAQRGFPPPPAFTAENAMNMKDGQIFHVITHGQNNMPPHGSQTTPEERWMITLHVRSLQGKNPAAEPAGSDKPAEKKAEDQPKAEKPEAKS